MISTMLRQHIEYQLETEEEVAWVMGDYIYYAFINLDNEIEYNVYDQSEMEEIDGGVVNTLDTLLQMEDL